MARRFEVPRFVSFADVIQCCPSSVATTLFRKVMPQIVSTGGSNIYKKSSLAFPIVEADLQLSQEGSPDVEHWTQGVLTVGSRWR